MTRRTFSAGAVLLGSAVMSPAQTRSRLGIATTCFMSYRRPKDTLEFLEYARGLGAAGIQASLASLDADYLAKVERAAKDAGMFVEVMAGLPRADPAQFTATLEGAKKIGALCVRSACLGGRRYETFGTLEEWRKFVADSHAALARAVPIAEKLKFPFAIENHKDWTADEMVAVLKKYESPYFGVCVDTGNNIALLDDPMDVVTKLMPFAFSTHIKDMAVESVQDGFLLSEVPLGKGILDIPRIVSMVPARAKLTLEMITRDPLFVPALTEKYWTTFPDRSGVYVVRTGKLLREKGSKLPRFSHLSREEQLKAEEDNVRACLRSL